MNHTSTNTPHDDAHQGEDRLLLEYFASRLDVHLGGSRRRFEQMLAEEAPSAPIRLHESRVSWNWGWRLGMVAAAACAVFAVGLWAVMELSKSGGQLASGPGTETALRPAAFTQIEYSESWQSQDLGVYEYGGQPVRAVHQQQWERARYLDSGYEVQIELPRSNLVLVDAPVQ